MRRALLAAALLAPWSAAAAGVVSVIDAGDLGVTDLGEWTGKRPSLADVDGDGDLDLVAQNGNARVYVIDLATERALVDVATRYPYGPDLGPFNGPKAADLDGDGVTELVNVNRAAVVTVWRLVPEDDGVRAEFVWDRHLDDHHGRPTADAGPVLGDLDGDSDLEIVVQTEERGVYALHEDGTLLWSRDEWGGNAEAVIEDVNADGYLDAVLFTDGGRAYAVDGPTGDVLWSFEAKEHDVWPGSAASPGVVADVDGDGRIEVAYCTRNVEDATTDHAPGYPHYREHHFVLFLVRDGELVWKRKPTWGNPLCSAYLTAADVEGDGRLAIIGMDWNTIGHKPGNWERTGDPNVFAYDASGDELWHRRTNAFNAKPHVALGDWSGDGRVDVVAYGDERLVVLDAATGRELERVRLDGDVKQGPLLADLLGTGRLHAIVAIAGARDAFVVIDSGVAYAEPAWPGWEAPALPDYPVPRRAPADDDPLEDPPPDVEDPSDGGEGVEFDAPPTAEADAPPPAGGRSAPAPAAAAAALGAAVAAGALAAAGRRGQR